MTRMKVVYDGSQAKPWNVQYSLTNAPVDDRRFATIEQAGAALRELAGLSDYPRVAEVLRASNA